MGAPGYLRILASRPELHEGSVIDNWQSGVATSGLAGVDLLTN